MEIDKLEIDNDITTPSILGYVKSLYEKSKEARERTGLDKKFIDNALSRSSKHSDEVLLKLKKNKQPTIYMPVSETKCINAIAWIRDIDNSVGNRSIVLEPTPIPELSQQVEEMVATDIEEVLQTSLQETGELPPEEEMLDLAEELKDEYKAGIKKEASDRAKAMHTKILDDLVESNWEEIKNEFRENCITFGLGFLKGPIIRSRKVMKWVENEYKLDTEYYKDGDAPSPIDVYWNPSSKKIGDSYIIERMREVTNSDLQEWKDYPDYKKDSIDELIKTYPDGFNKNSEIRHFMDRNKAENKDNDTQQSANGFYECFEFWGMIKGSKLKSAGVKKDLEDNKEYPYQIIWCADKIIKLAENPFPDGRSIYHAAVFKSVPGSVSGKGICDLVSTAQSIGNSAGRSLIMNMGLSASPQVDVDLEQLEPNVDWRIQYPGKVWTTRSKPGMTRKAIEYFQARDNSGQLISVYNWAMEMADNDSGVPRYGYGNDAGAGPARQTAAGLSMLLNASSRGLKESIWQMDSAIASYIKAMFVMEMMYGEDESIKGDCKIVIKGSMGVLLKELEQARIAEFLDRISSPVAMQIFGEETYVKTMREYGELIQLDVNNLLPSWEEVKKRLDEQQKMQQEAQQAAQQHELEMKDKELDIDREKNAIKAEDQKRKRAETIGRLEDNANKRINEAGTTPTIMQ